LQWDEVNIEHIAEHGISPIEVEEVCFGSNYSKKEGNSRYLVRGQTADGKYLMIVIERMGGGIFRPITAFKMSDGYKSGYRKQNRGRK
jgi:uncharacterized protein